MNLVTQICCLYLLFSVSGHGAQAKVPSGLTRQNKGPSIQEEVFLTDFAVASSRLFRKNLRLSLDTTEWKLFVRLASAPTSTITRCFKLLDSKDLHDKIHGPRYLQAILILQLSFDTSKAGWTKEYWQVARKENDFQLWSQTKGSLRPLDGEIWDIPTHELASWPWRLSKPGKVSLEEFQMGFVSGIPADPLGILAASFAGSFPRRKPEELLKLAKRRVAR